MSTRQSGFAGTRRLMRHAALAAMLSASLAACSSGPDAVDGTNQSTVAFTGAAFADEPQAAVVGRRILRTGGSAADAAAAMGFMLSVTLPSRASLGAGGACLAYDPASGGPAGGIPEAIVFNPVAGAAPGSADRPASVPMLARGLLALQARYGVLRPSAVISPAEQGARLGLPMSRALSRDIAVVAGPLAGDPAVRDIFYSGERPISEGAKLVQPALSATLARLRETGFIDLYQGELARSLVADMPRSGGGLGLADLRAAVPTLSRAWIVAGPDDEQLALLPSSERGAVATAAAATVLLDNPKAVDAAQQRAVAVAAAAKQGDAGNEKLLQAKLSAASIGPLPASATFGAVDAAGRAVVCGVSMGNLFGTGRLAQNTGILLAASPARAPSPLLSLALLFNRRGPAFQAIAGASGQEGAAGAAAIGLFAGMAGTLPSLPPEPGRVNVIACPGGVPKGSNSCAWSADPRSLGMAVGAN